MANHKRKRASHQRAGCHLCKPWKDGRVKNNGTYNSKYKNSELRKIIKEDELD